MSEVMLHTKFVYSIDIGSVIRLLGLRLLGGLFFLVLLFLLDFFGVAVAESVAFRLPPPPACGPISAITSCIMAIFLRGAVPLS